MKTNPRYRAASIAFVLLALGIIMEIIYYCEMYFGQATQMVLRIDMGFETFLMGIMATVGMFLTALSASMAVNAAWTLRKGDSDEHMAQARRMNNASIILTILGRVMVYEFVLMLILGLFIKKVILPTLIIGFIGLIITIISHWALLIILWPCKIKKLSSKGYRRIPAIGTALMAVFVIVALAVNAVSVIPEMNAKKNLKAIEIEAQSFTGETVTNELLQGKVTILNIWETTCGPCKQEMPDLEAVSKTLEGTNVQIVGLCFDTQVSEYVSAPHSIEEAQTILDERGVTYLNLQPGEELCKTIITFTSAFPTTVVLDENGNVLEIVTGSNGENEWAELAQKYIK